MKTVPSVRPAANEQPDTLNVKPIAISVEARAKNRDPAVSRSARKERILQVFLLSSLSLTACVSVPISTNIPETEYNFRSPGSQPSKELVALYDQTTGQEPSIAGAEMTPELYTIVHKPLVDEIAQNGFIKKYVQVLNTAANATDPSNVPKVQANAMEFKAFAEVLTKNFGVMLVGRERRLNRTGTVRSLDNILVAYFEDYFDGNYVTRDGTVLAKPSANISFSNAELSGSIGTDTVTGIVTVFLEGIHDFAQNVPVFLNGTKYINGSGSVPSSVAHTVVPVIDLTVANPCSAAISVDMWTKTRYISMASG
jgi:hypothetical protein